MKGQVNYLAVLVDLDTRKPIEIVKTRSREEIREVFKGWRFQILEQIQEVSIDFWAPYKSAMSGVSIHWIWYQGIAIAVNGAIVCWANYTFAQITPDNSLPNNSRVLTQGNVRIIEDGTKAGLNLFHSFSEFSVPNSSTVYFNNALNIQNIISRITGSSISNIDGLIKNNGTANLFLINPNGIIFGRNATLNIGGSFLASTANSLKFADNTIFDASASVNKTSLLTINVPIGLQYGSNPGSIQLQGSNLQVNPGQSLALIGGNLSIDNGNITSVGGRVELGGLARTGTVGLNIDKTGNFLSLSFPSEVQRSDVALINGTQVNVTASGGGTIAFNARNIDILGRSRVDAGISKNSGSFDTTAGNITVDATGTVTLRESSLIANQINSGATGTSGAIDLFAGSLNLLSGSQLFTSTSGQGNASNVNLNVGSQISVDGENPGISTSGVITAVGETGVGKGGDINISTGSLAVTNGAQLNALTSNKGDAGNVNINATDTVSFDGAGRNYNASGILTSVTPAGVGKGGDINITTKSLLVTNGAQLNILTKGQGNAGNIIINATDTASFDGANIYGGASGILSSSDKDSVGNGGEVKITTGSLAITNGAQLNAISTGQGNAGNVSLNARNTIVFDGVNPNGGVSGILTSVAPAGVGKGGDINITTKSLSLTGGAELITFTRGKGNAGNVNINAQDTISFDGADDNYNASGILASVRPEGVGKGGDINITTGKFSMTNGATLSTTSEGNGAAGNIEVGANSIRLDSATLRSDTIAGQGSIRLNAHDFLLLRHGSNVTTNATGTATGGNITINTNNLVAIPQEDSNISANATEKSGGRVIINVSGIFGIQSQQQDTPLSDITATGGNPQLNGTVEINTPDIDPSKGLVALPLDLVDVIRLVNQNICTRGSGSSFTISGRGGLPPSPNNVLNNDAVWEDWRLTTVPVTSNETEEQRSRGETGHPSTKKTDAEIVEAQGWMVNAQGEVILTAYGSTATLHEVGSLPSGCHLPVAK